MKMREMPFLGWRVSTLGCFSQISARVIQQIDKHAKHAKPHPISALKQKFPEFPKTTTFFVTSRTAVICSGSIPVVFFLWQLCMFVYCYIYGNAIVAAV